MIFKDKTRNIILLVITVILLVPLIAMIFTDEVKWSIFDFLVVALLLISVGFLFDFTVRKIKHRTYKIAACIAIILLLLIIWAELAVGIFGSPFAGN